MFVITMNHSKYSTEPYNIHLVLIIQGHRFVSSISNAHADVHARANIHTLTNPRVQEQQSMPLPLESQESVQGTAPSLSSKATIRSRGGGQVARVTVPAVARLQSRRLNPVLRLFAPFALTWAFVEAADAQIVNGPSSWPLWSRSAMTVLLEREGGHGTTKTSPVSCREWVGQGWQEGRVKAEDID